MTMPKITTTPITTSTKTNSMAGGRQPGAGRDCIGAGECGKASKEVDNGEEAEEKC